VVLWSPLRSLASRLTHVGVNCLPRPWHRSAALVALIATISLGAAIGLGAQRSSGQKTGAYSVFEFGSLDPGAGDVIRRLNSAGEIAGGGHGTGRGHQAFVLRRSGREDLTFQHRRDDSTSFDINDAGAAVGAFNSDIALRPFRKGRGSPVEPLATLANDPAGVALGINAHGEAVGYSSGPQGIRAVWWDRAGAVRALPGLPGADESRGHAINDGGDIVGVSGAIGAPRAVLWVRKGAVTDLGTLPGDTTSVAEAISKARDVVGLSDGPHGSRAVLWPRGARIRNLGVLRGGDSSRARGINKDGDVVGTSTSLLGTRAFIWTAAGGMQDLNDLASMPGLVFTDARSINDKGEILVIARPDPGGAVGHDPEDHELPMHVLVLTPVP
jgi:probable HAF family extracellular repeat protein